MKKILCFLIVLSFGNTALAKDKVIKGYADLHVHMFGNYGFAGAWFVGDPGVKNKKDLFNYCEDENEKFPWLKGMLSKIDPYISSFMYRGHCIPKKEVFPKWNDLAHQQVWLNDLKKAHADGLKLMVMSSVHSFVLCKILPDSRKDFDTCEDFPNHMRQLKAAKKFIAENNWVELALSPNDARRIIKQGKLAMIFSVESSNVFDSKDWKKEFDAYWDIGVRTLQIVHQFDNKMGGAAIHKPPLKFANYIRNWLRYDEFKGFDSEKVSYKTDFGNREYERNKMGLTETGKVVVQHMMSLGMPIDFAHMSEKTADDVYAIIDEHNYPFYISHGHFRDAMKDGLGRFEKSSSVESLKRLKKVDGIFGVRTIHAPTHTIDHKLQNNCDGSSLSFGHMLKFGEKLGINIAFGSDFNGFIAQTKPRFSDDDPDYCKGQKVKRVGTNFDTVGLGNINLLNDLMRELKNLKVETGSLNNSAEKYIQVWERSVANKLAKVKK